MARSRPRIYDAEDLAIGMTETFKDRPYEERIDYHFSWPAKLQNVGDSLAVAYDSDKWKPKDKEGRRDWELYKHIAESRNRAFIRPGFLRDFYSPRRKYPVRGPMVSFLDVPMPKHFSVLALFEEINLQLYTQGTSRCPGFSDDPNEGVVKVTVRHGLLGGGFLLWSKVDRRRANEPFIFVYTEDDGVCILIVGEELDVEKDGIVG